MRNMCSWRYNERMEGGGVSKQRHCRYRPHKSLDISLICFSIELGKADGFYYKNNYKACSITFGGKQLDVRLNVLPVNQEELPNINLWSKLVVVFLHPSCRENEAFTVMHMCFCLLF